MKNCVFPYFAPLSPTWWDNLFDLDEGSVVKNFVSRVAGMSVGLMVATSAVMAGEFDPMKASGSQCYALVSDFAGGISSISTTKNMETSKHVVAVAAEFKQIMSASEQAHRCYLKMMSADDADLDALVSGAESAGKVFETAQMEFGGWVDDMSLVLLADVAPAAGGDTQADLVAEAQMEEGMELMINSYMLLEDADVLTDKLARLSKRGK